MLCTNMKCLYMCIDLGCSQQEVIQQHSRCVVHRYRYIVLRITAIVQLQMVQILHTMSTKKADVLADSSHRQNGDSSKGCRQSGQQCTVFDSLQVGQPILSSFQKRDHFVPSPSPFTCLFVQPFCCIHCRHAAAKSKSHTKLWAVTKQYNVAPASSSSQV